MLKDNAYCSEICRDAHARQLGLVESSKRPASGGMRKTISHSSSMSSTSSFSTESSQSAASMQDLQLVRFEPISETAPFLTTRAGRKSAVDRFLTGIFEGLAHVGSNAF